MRVLMIALAVMCSVFGTQSARAGERIALVMANAAYTSVPALKNPPTDAALVASALREAGFTRVDTVSDGNKSAMERALRDFSARADKADVALVYYAGHGIETAGRNFLIPVDARLQRDRDTDFEAVALDNVIRATEGARMRLVVLDACRDNPFVVSMAREGQGRSVGRGLARVEPSTDTLVVYAARAGAIAADGNGRNSPFAKALASRIVEPGLEISLLFRRVRDDVLKATDGEQEPFTYGSLSGNEFYFVVPAGSKVTIAVDTGAQTEALLWQGALAANNQAAYDDYLARYPNGTFASVARANLVRLKTPVAGPVAPVRAPSKRDFALPAGAAAYSLTPEFRNKASYYEVRTLAWKVWKNSREGELKAAADGGNADAALIYAMAHLWWGANTTDRLPTAERYFKQAADAGYGAAMNGLASVYMRTTSVKPYPPINQPEALKLYDRAIALGNVSALCEKASVYQNSNEAQRRALMKRASDAGDPACQDKIAYLYQCGCGGYAKNDAQAALLLRKASDGGLVYAARTLGNALLKGSLGLQKDEAEGARLLAIAEKLPDFGTSGGDY